MTRRRARDAPPREDMAWNFSLCGSSRDVDEEAADVRRLEASAATPATDPAPSASGAGVETDMVQLMEFYSQASALYSQARLAVDMLEDQRAAGSEVDEAKLAQARAVMAETRKALDAVGMRQTA